MNNFINDLRESRSMSFTYKGDEGLVLELDTDIIDYDLDGDDIIIYGNNGVLININAANKEFVPYEEGWDIQGTCGETNVCFF